MENLKIWLENAGEIVPATIKTSKGDIKVALLAEVAPRAVENFSKLATNGEYDGSTFHRVIKDFMIQGGKTASGKSIYGMGFANECGPEAFHFNGALSMANTGMPNSNTTQFFIVQNDEIAPGLKEAMANAGFPGDAIETYVEIGGTPHLDGKHTVFGYVTEGMDVVNRIADVDVSATDEPFDDVVIITIVIEEVE